MNTAIRKGVQTAIA
jgi:hypothetical protein